ESGFSEARSGALLAAGGGIGIIVPPSVALILYCVVAETSISQLFLAGVLPGITVSLALIIAVLLLSRRDQIPAHPPRLDWSVAGGSILALLAPVIILGGIYLSIFTPTESAGAAVLYIFLVDWIFYRSLFQEGKLLNVLIRTGRGSAQIFFIIAGGSLFAWVLHQTHLTEDLSGAVLQISQNRIVLLLLINAFLLIAGCFIDAISIIYIFVPVFQPALQQVGVDPVHFGIILTVNMAIGQITPPVGVNLFMASTTTGLNVSQLSRAVIPFLIAEFTALMVITFLPPLSLVLPGFMRVK
ncbi:MAG: TRAP transporter large permease, partial [Candidatus Omnitrophica bacterium]|nr:TRAP transporter large permease [Candidatus Omnitrophota bacterium]